MPAVRAERKPAYRQSPHKTLGIAAVKIKAVLDIGEKSRFLFGHQLWPAPANGIIAGAF